MLPVHTLTPGQLSALLPLGRDHWSIHAVSCESSRSLAQLLSDGDFQSRLPNDHRDDGGCILLAIIHKGDETVRMSARPISDLFVLRYSADAGKWVSATPSPSASADTNDTEDEFVLWLLSAVVDDKKKILSLIMEREKEGVVTNQNAVTCAMSTKTHRSAAASAASVPASGPPSARGPRSVSMKFTEQSNGRVSFRGSGDVSMIFPMLMSMSLHTDQNQDSQEQSRGSRSRQGPNRSRSRGGRNQVRQAQNSECYGYDDHLPVLGLFCRASSLSYPSRLTRVKCLFVRSPFFVLHKEPKPCRRASRRRARLRHLHQLSLHVSYQSQTPPPQHPRLPRPPLPSPPPPRPPLPSTVVPGMEARHPLLPRRNPLLPRRNPLPTRSARRMTVPR